MGDALTLLQLLKDADPIASLVILAAIWSLDRRLLKIEWKLGTRRERRARSAKLL